MDVSIIIVNYNTISFLVNAIDSIFIRTESIEYEIIVVDNNSTDNSETILAGKYGAKVVYLGLSDNIGFGRANNEAVKIARGRNLFFLNPDTILLNNAVKILSDFLDNNINVGCCGGNLFDEVKHPTFSFARIFPSLFEELDNFFFFIPRKILFRNNLYFNHSFKPLSVAAIIGADLMISKDIFKRLSGFDPDFFLFYEEIELEYRIHKAGYEVMSIPIARIIHLEGKSILNDYTKRKMYWDARELYLRKTQSKFAKFLINKLFSITASIRLLIFTIIGNKEKIALWSELYKLATTNSSP